MRGVSARRVCTSPPEDSAVRSLSYQTCSDPHPNGRHRIRRVEAAARPHPRALPVEWLVEREDNQTQNRQDCGVHGTPGGRRSSAEVEQNTLAQNIYLASLFIRRCIKQPKHSTPCLDVTPRRSCPCLVIQFRTLASREGVGGGWSLDPVSTLLKWMLRSCHFVHQLSLKCLISRFQQIYTHAKTS